MMKKDLEPNYPNQRKSELLLTNWRAVKTGIIIGLIPTVIPFLFGIFVGIVFAFSWGTIMAVPGGIIGALIGKIWKNTLYATRLGGVVGAILGIGLWQLLTNLGINLFGINLGVPQ